ncbi:MAG: hypothetical protein O2877_02305 [bacterium]|nr:hypothetical protein [bacterium]
MILFITIAICFITVIIEFFLKGKLVIIIPYGIVIPLLVLLPRFFFYPRFKNIVSATWLKHLEIILLFVVLINAPASLWFHDLGFQYDRFLHFFAAFLATLFIIRFFSPLFETRSTWYLLGILTVLVSLTFVWEGLQWSIDMFFNTYLFHDSKQIITIDFWEDISFGSLGAALAVLFTKTIPNSRPQKS